MPDSPAICPVCGARLTTETAGLCPKCTLRQTFDTERAMPQVDRAEVDGDWLAQHGIGDAEETPASVRLFAGYRLEGELGRGGMGVVYAAVQPGVNRRVALKILSPTVSGPGGDARRFQNEVEAASRLDHPNILPVYEYGEHEGQWFYTMKLAKGGNLAEHISDLGSRISDAHQAPSEIKQHQCRIGGLILQLSRAVAYAHQRGILHRDLKPANILLDAERTALISDFGLAKFLEEDRGLTLTQGVVGTPGYMAPEQARGRKDEVTTATDVYGLGTILYELLTGRPPFQGDSTVETLRQVVEEEVRPPHQIRPRTNRDLETICLKCLAKEPSQRYPTANALAEDLERWLAGDLISARPASTVQRAWRWCRRRPVLTISLLIVAVLAVFSTIVAVRLQQEIEVKNRESYYANISLAYEHIQKGDIEQGRNLLLGCPEELRNWEWGHLMYLCHQAIAFIPSHTNTMSLLDARYSLWRTSLRELRFAPDGQHFVTLLHDGRLRIWNVLTGTEVHHEGSASDKVGAFSFSRDGASLAVAYDKKVTILRTDNWLPRQQVPTEDRPALSLAWGILEGQQLLARLSEDDEIRVWAASGEDYEKLFRARVTDASGLEFTEDSTRLSVHARRTIVVLDALRGGRLATFEPPTSPSGGPRLDPQGKRWVSIDADRRLWLGDSATKGRPLGMVRGPIPAFVYRVFFTADGTRFCTGGEEGSAQVWDASTGTSLFSVPDRVCHAAFSPDGKLLATAGNLMAAHVWDIEKGTRSRLLAGHTEVVDKVAFSPDGRFVLTASRDGTVGVWPATPGRDLLDGDSILWGAALSADGRLCATTPAGRGLWLWDARTGALRARLNAEHDVFFSAAFSPDGIHVATDSKLREPRIWNRQTGELVHTLRGHRRAVWPVVYSPDGRILATGDYAGEVRLWDADTGRELHHLIQSKGGYCAIAFSADSKLVATGASADEVARVWSVDSGKVLHELPGHTAGCVALGFQPNTGLLAVAAMDNRIRFWDVKHEIVVRSLHLRGNSYAFAFTPDGSRLAAWTPRVAYAGHDVPSLAIWDAEAGRRVLSLRGHTQLGLSPAFSKNGRRLLTGSIDRTARQWETFPWSEADYPGREAEPFPERIQAYAKTYWEERIQAEASAEGSGATLIENFVPFDRAKIPPRSSAATAAQLDLTACYTSPLDLPFEITFADDYDQDLCEFPAGLQEFNGVRFDARGVLLLRRHMAPHFFHCNLWNQLPVEVDGIAVLAQVNRLHLLGGAVDRAADGTAIGVLRWLYADGTEEETEIVYGRHVRSWWMRRDSRQAGEGEVAWQGSNPTAKEQGTEVRIWQFTLENPRPEAVVESVSLHSGMTHSALFVLALTAE